MDCCRLCLRTNAEMFDILNLHENDRLQIMIKTLFSIEFQINNSLFLPRKICSSCQEYVQDFYSFYDQVKRNQASLMLKSQELYHHENNLNYVKEHQKNSLAVIRKSVIKLSSKSADLIGSQNLAKTEGFDITLLPDFESTENVPPSAGTQNKDDISDHKNVICYQKQSSIKKEETDEKNKILPEVVDVEIKSDQPEFDEQENVTSFYEDVKTSKAPKEKPKLKKLILKTLEQKKLTALNYPSTNITTDNFATNCENIEIYKNGKLAIHGKVLQNFVCNFYYLRCDICEISPQFISLQELYKHYGVKHGSKGYVTCCNTRIFRCRDAYVHMASHIQPEAFQCHICGKEVSRPSILKIHLRTHLPESERPYKCNQCDRRYSCATGLADHKLTHIPIVARKIYECQECHKKFTLLKSFTGHMATVHASVKYLCAECGKTFQTKTNFTVHMATHDHVESNAFQCIHCGVVCKNNATLTRHLKKHTSAKIHCKLCDFATHLSINMNRHMWVKHSDLKPYECLICRKKFKLKSVLEEHKAQHTGERKYICPFCPKTFVSSGNYYTHRKRVHANIKKNIKPQNTLN